MTYQDELESAIQAAVAADLACKEADVACRESSERLQKAREAMNETYNRIDSIVRGEWTRRVKEALEHGPAIAPPRATS